MIKKTQEAKNRSLLFARGVVIACAELLIHNRKQVSIL